MTAPGFLSSLMAWRGLKASSNLPYAPANADSANAPSVAIAEHVMLELGIARVVPEGTTFGRPFEIALTTDLKTQLPLLDPNRTWMVDEGVSVSKFEQYKHMDTLDAAMKSNVTLRTEFGREYHIAPDITIGLDQPGKDPLLHAVISVKWSMRSDRVQNVRPEGATLTRHRRGRAPHFVVVTCEPLPSRIASIAMTTGEVDRVYHVAFEETERAVHQWGTTHQVTHWDEMVSQGRLRDYNELATTLALT